jgi:hypothetical protein
VAGFSPLKSDDPQTTIATLLTAKKPQNHHISQRFLQKTPAKTHNYHAKKIRREPPVCYFWAVVWWGFAVEAVVLLAACACMVSIVA